jgi:hypothetical protein
MKKSITASILLISTISFSQIHLHDKDRYSIHLLTDNAVFQKGIFYGGVEFNAEFSNGIYVRPQIHYASLKDGYLETSAGMGLNLALNNVNFYSGLKLGLINRARTYPLFAIEAGIEIPINNTLRIGVRGSYDSRGDSNFYEGKSCVWNTQGYLIININ